MNLGPSPIGWDGPLWARVVVAAVALAWWAVQLHGWLCRWSARRFVRSKVRQQKESLW